jgi:hypothetical protein
VCVCVCVCVCVTALAVTAYRFLMPCSCVHVLYTVSSILCTSGVYVTCASRVRSAVFIVIIIIPTVSLNNNVYKMCVPTHRFRSVRFVILTYIFFFFRKQKKKKRFNDRERLHLSLQANVLRLESVA